MLIPKKTAERISSRLRHYQPILKNALDRDVNESNTVTIVVDMLADLFGFDKYSEITTEFAIKSCYCDLAIKLDEKLVMLIEVKAIGIPLKQNHVTQAINYAANHGADWVMLTNGGTWRLYKVIFGQPIDQELVMEVDMFTCNPRNAAHADCLYVLTKEGLQKKAVWEYHAQRQAIDRFAIAAVLQSEPMLKALRKELRLLTPNVNVDMDDIKQVLINEVMKREVQDGEKAATAAKQINKSLRKREKEAAGKVAKPAVETVLLTTDIEPDEEPPK